MEGKKTRTDKKRSIAKVAKEVINNPLATEREIAESTGLGNATVHRAKKEVEQTGAKDPRIVGICDTDLEIVILGQSVILERLKDPEERKKISSRDVSGIIRENTARYSIFKGDITDAEGGLKNNIKDLPTNDLLSIVNEDN